MTDRSMCIQQYIHAMLTHKYFESHEMDKLIKAVEQLTDATLKGVTDD